MKIHIKIQDFENVKDFLLLAVIGVIGHRPMHEGSMVFSSTVL